MQLATKILEDKSTILQLQIINSDSPNSLIAPLAQLVSIFAVQPSQDIQDASKTLLYAVNQPGVQVIRQIFPAKLAHPKRGQSNKSLTGLMLLIRVTLKFRVRSEQTLSTILREVRKEFVRRRSITYTVLEASGCKVTLITGKKLTGVLLHGEKIAEGITVFKGQKGFQSKLLEPFLRLDRVPSRFIHDLAAPDLPVVHKIGTRIDNPTLPVGFPTLKTGTLLTCGSSNYEVLLTLQQIVNSIVKIGNSTQFFAIDTHNELNGLIRYYQADPSNLNGLNLQVFRLGTNIHLNLCDVIIPLAPSGKKKEAGARAAWKSHIISQIILGSLDTSEYLTARYSVPLESQIRNTAESGSLFTLQNIKMTVGAADPEVNREGVDMMFADMMAIESIAGILEQFRSFPEVNYPAFTGHYGNTLVREKTLTIFQFGAQPPLIRRATIAFLLHYLSQIMKNGCVVLTHAAEFLSRRTVHSRAREIVSSSIVDACNTIARQNLMVLGSQSLQALAVNMDTFEEIKNRIYLKMVNSQDREIVITQHELDYNPFKDKGFRYPSYAQQQFLGITEGEGLLFREDISQNTGFHFKLDRDIAIDLETLSILETKQRGSETLGLTPTKFAILMKFLKLLVQQPYQTAEIISLVKSNKQGELSLEQFKTLGLCDVDTHTGAQYWVITQKGREFYNAQFDFLNTFPVPLTNDEVTLAPQELNRLESFYDISSSYTDRLETNTKVKLLVGRMLNYLRHLKTTIIPWVRIAEYHDLIMINSLEWQDFRNLFDLAHSMINNMLLEITKLHKQRSLEEIQQSLQTSSIRPISEKHDLDDFLPDDNFSILQKISRELGIEPYPKIGILDIYYLLHKENKSLFDELESYRGGK